ncbi:MAG: hypothetical protein Q4C91_07745 [Eubacteriales bacterium]|nr:hypothetical protein [Eubacteriales bacterium]
MKNKNMKNITAAFLFAVLLVNPAEGVSKQLIVKAESDADVLDNFMEAHKISSILEQHDNVALNVIYYDPEGNVETSVYQYADNETIVLENDDSYLDIQYRDGYYLYDPDTDDKVQAVFGMEGVAETQWEERMNNGFSFDYTEDEDDEILELTESENRIILKVASEADPEYYPGWEDEIEADTRSVYELELDSETYMVYEAVSYLKKADGTELKEAEYHFSYDVAPYEPSEEMLQVINGTDNVVTLIADPGTEQEKTYVKSCGENGRLAVMLADGYENIYEDEACTRVREESEETGERTVYTKKESE